ncbi:MAG: response regulator, partial [Cyanobacteria bacterium KgW148]|nr:response regulator [Cyanobacteria bacterium KgW148]
STLQQQAEFFLGIAQSYNLSNWENCAQQVLDMLSTDPDDETLVMVAQVALENYRQTCKQILEGDRGVSQAVEPTVESKELPPVQTTPIAVVPKEIPQPKEQPIEKKTETIPEVKANLTVRVPIEQLENLNYDLGELLINFNQQSLNAEQTSTTSKESLANLYECRAKLRQVQDWADLNLASNVNLSFNNDQFDRLEMDEYGELHILLQNTLESMSILGEKLEDMNSLVQTGLLNLKKQKRILTEIQDHLVQTRTVPLSNLLDRFPAMVQQLAHSYNKQVELVLTGNPTLVDKGIVEQLYEPLLHLIRNAFDHGIESKEVRLERGKDPTGKIIIHTEQFGNRITLQVKDDGQGLDWQKIRQKGIEKGLINNTDRLSETELAELLFMPGFSTASQLSELSGRGVGLDVVRNKLQTIETSIAVDSQPHKGTTFTLKIPVNLTTLNLLVCQSQGIPYGFLIDSIQQIILPMPNQIHSQNNRRMLVHTDRQKSLVPIFPLGDLVQYNRPNFFSTNTNTSLQAGFYALGSPTLKPLLLIKNTSICLEVDQILAEQELVLKSFRPQPHLVPYILGYTVLGDGKYTLVIDPDRLIQQEPPPPPSSLPPIGLLSPDIFRVDPPSLIAEQPPVLLVDDSITQRQSMVLTLQKAGIKTIQAQDGYEALRQVAENPSLGLIICDIEMPRMNGFDFLRTYRSDPDLPQVPVIILTSRSGDKHRQTAMELGATDYMTKPYNDRELIDKINSFIGK